MTLLLATAGFYAVYWMHRTAYRGDSIGKRAMDFLVAAAVGPLASLGCGSMNPSDGSSTSLPRYWGGLWMLCNDACQTFHHREQTYVTGVGSQ